MQFGVRQAAASRIVSDTCFLCFTIFFLTRVSGEVSNNNDNIQDNVHGAVIAAEPLREFTRFIW